MMFELCQRDEPDSPEVHFDEYVPITITWPEAHRLLEAPRYVTLKSSGRLLELKFHPQTRRLIEAVLVSAASIERGHGSLAPVATDDAGTACAFDDATASEGHDLAGLVAYDDCLVIGIAPDSPTTWVGVPPALVGLNSSSEIVALCILWGGANRDFLLSMAQ